MGKITSSKRNGEQIVFEVEVDYEEAIGLQGHFNNVHLFSENVAEFETNIATRGKNGATKYFLIPRKIRNKMNLSSMVNCQKIETKEKILFVYVVDKNSPNGMMVPIEKSNQ
ncbi:MAG: hypothetical protein ACLFUO_02325 [Candidatus Woesearchaeota archaeon]